MNLPRYLFLLRTTLCANAVWADCHFFAAAGSGITPRYGNCKGAADDPKNGLKRCYHRDKAELQTSELNDANGKLPEVALEKYGENDRGKISFTESGTVNSVVSLVASMVPEDHPMFP